MINTKQALVWGAWLVVFLIGSVEAQNSTTSSTEEALLVPVEKGLNTSWMLLCGFLVFFMQAGFAILEAGAVAKSDTRNILFKNLLDVCVAGLAWWGFGFAFAFGTGDHHGRGFIGARYFFADDFPNAEEGVGYAFWFFEFCFAAASATIVSGAVAERATFQVYVCWCLISTIWVYPVVAHWEWSSQGWLSATNSVDPVLDIGMIDFAGCGAVHMVGGVGALIGAVVSGFRNKRSKVSTFKPRFEKVNSKWLVNDIPGKSEIFSSLGVLMLWFSWYGFNCGSTLLISSANAELTAARVSATTTLSACAGGLTCVILGRFLSSTGKFNINDANNGILAGLVSITAGCACVELWAAVIIGIFGAIFFKFGSFLLLKFRIDDPVEASPLHLGCGIWGLMACGIFATQEYNMEVYGRGDHYGLFMGGGGRQLGAQFVGVLAIGGWTAFWAALFWIPAKLYDKRRQDKIFFKEEDVTGGVDQRFISVALTKDLHSTLANIGADLATEGSVGEIRVEMEHPGVMRSGSTLGERDKENEELLKILSLNPGKRRAFLEFIESLPDDEDSEYGGHSERSEIQRSGRSHRSHNTRGTNRQSVSSAHNTGTHSNVTTGNNINITGGHSNPNTGH